MNFEELLPLYVLDAVTNEERTWIEKYLSEHPEAQAEMLALQEEAALLNELVEPIEPPAHIKQTLMGRIDAHPRAQAFARKQQPARPVANTAKQAATAPSWWERFRAGFALPAFAGVAALAAFIAFMWGANLQQQVNNATALNSNNETIIESLQTDALAYEAELATFEQMQRDLTASVQNAEAQVATVQSELAAAQEQNTLLEAEQAALQEQNAQLVAQAAEGDDVSAEITALREEIAILESEAAELQLTNEALQDQLDQQTLRLAIFNSPNLATIPVGSTEVQPDAFGHLVMTSSNTQSAVFNAWGLETLDIETETYQLWLINDDGPAGVGEFNLDTDGLGTVLVNSDILGDYNAIGVTVEPPGGSDAPTSDIVLLGTR